MATDSSDMATMDIKNDVKPAALLNTDIESDDLSDVGDIQDWKEDDNADDSYAEDVKVTPSKKRKQGNGKVKSESAPSTPTKGGKRAAKAQDSPKKGPSKFWTPGNHTAGEVAAARIPLTHSSPFGMFLLIEEEAALWKGIGCVALNDVSGVKAFSGLADRNLAQVNMKIRGELKVSRQPCRFQTDAVD